MVKKLLLITAVIMGMTFTLSNVLMATENLFLSIYFHFHVWSYIFAVVTIGVLAFFNVKYAIFLRDFKLWRFILTVALGLFTIFVFVLNCYSSIEYLYSLLNTIAAVILGYTVGVFIKDVNKDEEWKLIIILSIVGISFEVLTVVIYNAIVVQSVTYCCLELIIPIAVITLAIFSFVYQHKEKMKSKLNNTKQ